MTTPRFITTPSLNLNLCYVQTGCSTSSLPPIVLVHGFLSSHRTFDPLLELLAPHREVYALDLPGYGRSQPATLTQAYDRDFFAAAVLDFADAKGLQRFILVGHSMGGGVCQAVADRAPERLEQLVLINSVGVEVPWTARLASIPLLGPVLFGLFFTVMSLLGRFASHRGFRPLACARAVAQATLKRMLSRLHRAKASLSRIQVPTALLWGERDSLLSLTGAYRLADIIPRASVRVISGAGHFPTTEAPQKVSQALLEAIRR